MEKMAVWSRAPDEEAEKPPDELPLDVPKEEPSDDELAELPEAHWTLEDEALPKDDEPLSELGDPAPDEGDPLPEEAPQDEALLALEKEVAPENDPALVPEEDGAPLELDGDPAFDSEEIESSPEVDVRG